MGRDRETGPDPLARLAGPTAEQAPWGVTGMPSWLDTPRGRQAWSADDEFDCLDADADRQAGDRVDAADDPDDGWEERDDPAAAEVDRTPGLESLGDGDEWEDDWDPPRRRLTMLPPAAIGLIVVGLIAAGIAGYSLLKQNEPVAPLVAFDSSASSSVAAKPGQAPEPSAAPTPSADGQIVVSVVGLVKRPGLVRIPNSARVADAIDRAGGARPGADLISLNMAQLLRDGDQILVGKGGAGTVKSAVVAAAGSAPAPGPGPESSGPAAPPAGGTTPAPGTGLVNLNSATAEQLEALPGVGPVTAAAIIAWREANGQFTAVEQLAEVDGIGPARLAKLTPLVTVG